MQYRKDKYGNDISLLGFGCLRFKKDGNKIDMAEAERQIMEAIELGVNYFDTAYVYTGSEAAIGEIFEKNHVRDKVTITTKLPHYMIKKTEDLDKYFDEELKRLRTDHVDCYLMHMLTDVASWERLKGLGILKWLEDKKARGIIGQIGFSYHGNSDMFIQLVDAYDWDLTQIQYNYMDENTQAGRKGLMHAAKKGIPVIIMEPLRGGRLVNNLPAEAKKIFEEYPTKHSPADWAFRWLMSQPEVTCVLSGMNDMDMVRENVKTADECQIGELTEADEEMLASVAKAINGKMKVGCTGCGYCMPCPKNVDIPGAFAAYNRLYTDGWYTGMKEYVMCTALRANPTSITNCVGCGKCETHCPQGIAIREELKRARKKLDTPIYKIVKKGAHIFLKY